MPLEASRVEMCRPCRSRASTSPWLLDLPPTVGGRGWEGEVFDMKEGFVRLQLQLHANLTRNHLFAYASVSHCAKAWMHKSLLCELVLLPGYNRNYMNSSPANDSRNAFNTEIKAKRKNMISELITFWITKAKAKVKFGVKSLCEHECKVSSVPININAKAKATRYSRGINFTLISVATVMILWTMVISWEEEKRGREGVMFIRWGGSAGL